MSTLTKNYTKGQKQALLESLREQFEAGRPMTKAERALHTELTAETCRPNVLKKLNTLCSKIKSNEKRQFEIEEQEFKSKSERKELENTYKIEEKLDKELMKYISERQVTQDELIFSDFGDYYEGDTMDMMNEFTSENNLTILK